MPCHEDILQFLEALLVVQLQEGRGGSVTGIWWEVARHATEHPVIHRTEIVVPHNKKLSDPKFQWYKAEKLYSRP